MSEGAVSDKAREALTAIRDLPSEHDLVFNAVARAMYELALRGLDEWEYPVSEPEICPNERFEAIQRELADLIPEGEAIIFSREGYSVEHVRAMRAVIEAWDRLNERARGVTTDDRIGPEWGFVQAARGTLRGREMDKP
jgi:hypothetical protein